ncbi:hypothetical protein [Nitrosomonas sp.]|uniref:hypothetical protein n=1 Tax=Nitrosomonas sp. TaxID=42353 RepID=UPI00284EC1D4|nr:hypothetical protein [Nitrosomonas sp.]MDR4515323.1 hypothetical protein [Nitrosomonas sp.]
MIVKKTACTLREIELLLESFKVKYAIFVKKYRKELEQLTLDDSKTQLILPEIKNKMLAGMGSLNDVWISKDNGHDVEDEVSANKKLENLRNKLRKILENY